LHPRSDFTPEILTCLYFSPSTIASALIFLFHFEDNTTTRVSFVTSTSSTFRVAEAFQIIRLTPSPTLGDHLTFSRHSFRKEKPTSNISSESFPTPT
jgi:hypothetical protein